MPYPNETWATATVLSGETGSITPFVYDPANNTSINEPGEYDSGYGKTLWWKWTAPVTQRYGFDTTGSGRSSGHSNGLDTHLAVFTEASGIGSPIVINDDWAEQPFPYNSMVAFDAVAGTTYYIQLACSQVSDAGGLKLNWEPKAPVFYGNWVPNNYEYAWILDAGPYLGTDQPLPPPVSSMPADANWGELYWVVQSGSTVLTSFQQFYDSPYSGSYVNRSGNGGTFDSPQNVAISEIANPHLFIVLYGGYTANGEPSTWLAPAEPESSFYPASYAAGGTGNEGVNPPLPAATNITPQSALLAADLYPSTTPPMSIRDYTLETAGVTWWTVRTYPRTTDPVSDASGGFTATVPADTELTVWRVAGLPLADVPATAPIVSGSGTVGVSTVPGRETYLLRITGTGERRDGLKVVGLGIVSGQEWITYTDPEWHIVPGEHTYWGHLLEGSEFYDGYVGHSGNYIENGLVSHRQRRDVTIDNITNGDRDEIGQPAGDFEGDALAQWYYQSGGTAYQHWLEIQGSVHYSDALLQHYWDIEVSARAEDFIIRATNASWTQPLPWAEIPELPSNSLITFDDQGTYRWEAEYDLDYFALSDNLYLQQTFWQERPNYEGQQMEHRWSRGKLANSTGPGYGSEGYSNQGYINPSPNHKAYSTEVPENVINSEDRHSPDVLPVEYPLRSELDGETWWLAGVLHASDPISNYNPDLIIGQSMGWLAHIDIDTYMLIRVPRYRFKLSYIGRKQDIPMRQRHRDDGLATDAREQKGHASSQQISNRRGGRTYY